MSAWVQIAGRPGQKLGSVRVPNDRVGRLIGPKGSVINKIRDDTGVPLLHSGTPTSHCLGDSLLKSGAVAGGRSVGVAVRGNAWRVLVHQLLVVHADTGSFMVCSSLQQSTVGQVHALLPLSAPMWRPCGMCVIND